MVSYRAPNDGGGEEDFISEHFGLDNVIGQLDLAYNYQMHQVSQTGVIDHDEGR